MGERTETVIVAGVMMRFVYSRRSAGQYIRTIVFFPRKATRLRRDVEYETRGEDKGNRKEQRERGEWRWPSVSPWWVVGRTLGEEPVAD